MYVTKVNYQLEDGRKATAEFANQHCHPMEGFVEFEDFYIRFSGPTSNQGMNWESVVFDQTTDAKIEEVFVQINEVTFVQ
jgi:hypothetical protein